MADQSMKKPPFDPGVFRSKQREGISSTEVVAGPGEAQRVRPVRSGILVL